jgi:serine phosphatase RsbU (regulator of sigma subunit)
MGWSVASLYEPVGDASAAGGDFYDLFTVPGGHMAVIGDVTGHGPEAARLTSLARYTLRTAGELTADPLRAMQQLNTALQDGGELQLATALCVHIRHEPNGRVWARIVSAGHPLPLIVSDRGVRRVGNHGLIAGFAPEPEWTAVETELAPGDTLVLYTDGVTDARRGSERFGEARLLDCVAAAAGDPEALISSVRVALAAFRDCPAEDDVALLALHYDPTGVR